MLENLFVAALLIIALLISDLRNFKQADTKTKAAYVLLLLPATYLSILFIFHLSWPNIGSLSRLIYGWPAKQLLALLK
ncbi:hypothetical protein [Paenibacillus luteus]|uniref:hypothetical protein n=1 Tax=Paenibacillus luteus TaxID=2545753 RepID=UPI0011426C9F|nr:hypothetical protein [Paenibacillus luteus]